jgi:predicted O-methyltransferase YrrM
MAERYRSSLLADPQLIPSSYGAGTRLKEAQRTVAQLAKSASVSAQQGSILFRCARWFQPRCIIELGTSLGVSTLYLAQGCPQSKIYTVEGNATLAGLAGKAFEDRQMKQIILMNCDFSIALQDILSKTDGDMLVFIDGDHSFLSTLKYFDTIVSYGPRRCMMIFDDICWSADMIRAWDHICHTAKNSILVNTLRMGIVWQY